MPMIARAPSGKRGVDRVLELRRRNTGDHELGRLRKIGERRVGGRPEDCAPVSVHELHAPAMGSAQGSAREQAAPFGGIARSAHNGHGPR